MNAEMRQRAADAALLALKATENAYQALQAAEELDEQLERQARAVRAAREALRLATIKLRYSMGDLNRTVWAHVDGILVGP
jgi:outer membrane protein TolC